MNTGISYGESKSDDSPKHTSTFKSNIVLLGLEYLSSATVCTVIESTCK